MEQVGRVYEGFQFLQFFILIFIVVVHIPDCRICDIGIPEGRPEHSFLIAFVEMLIHQFLEPFLAFLSLFHLLFAVEEIEGKTESKIPVRISHKALFLEFSSFSPVLPASSLHLTNNLNLSFPGNLFNHVCVLFNEFITHDITGKVASFLVRLEILAAIVSDRWPFSH